MQGRRAFADLRVPATDEMPSGLPPAACFAGTTESLPGRLRWRHELDLAPDGAEDEGDVAWDGDVLVERGTFVLDGRPVPYEERWHRLPGADGPVAALAAPDGRLVRVGDHALVVRRVGGTLAAAALERRGGAWQVVLRLGDQDGLPRPPDDVPPVGTSLELGDAEWVVTERAR